MKNLKPAVKSALENDSTLNGLLGGNHVYFQRPKNAAQFPRITYREADNRDFPFGDDLEGVSEIIIVVDVYNKDASTSDIAIAVDSVMGGQGFYREFAADLYEEVNNVFHKSMRYRKLKIFDGTTGIIPVDTWLEALSVWTQTELGSGWNVFRNPFPERYERPAVIWVLTGQQTEDGSRAAYRLTKKFTGIVIGNLPMLQHGAAGSIVSGLQRDIKIPLDVIDRRYLRVDRVSVLVRDDALTAGRVTTDLSRLVNRPTTASPLMTKVNTIQSVQ